MANIDEVPLCYFQHDYSIARPAFNKSNATGRI